MYDHHDAILHAVSEGLIVLDRNRVVLVNDEARRLLALGPGPVSVADLPEFLQAVDPGVRDELHVTDERVLVVNRARVPDSGSEVVTVRDRTELQGALGELSSLQVLADSLRAQAHESANKLHTVITMVEMGRRQIVPSGDEWVSDLALLSEVSAHYAKRAEDAADLVEAFGAAVDALEREAAAARAVSEENPGARAAAYRAKVVPAMAKARAAGDALERACPARLWPFPGYSELLFSI